MTIAAEPLALWLLGALAVLLAGFSKAASGGGIAILAVPLLSLVIAPTRAAAIMLPLLCLIDLVGLWAYRRHVDRSLLLELLPGALVGIAVGAFVFSTVDVRWIKLLPYASLGLLDASNLATSMLLAPVVPLGYWIGYRFARQVPEKWFFAFVNWSLVVTGIKLLYDVVAG